jgi:hypothetical protein
MIYDIGGWLFYPSDQSIYTIVGGTDYRLTLNDRNGRVFYYHLENVKLLLDDGSHFYIAPTEDEEKFMKEIMLINLKYKGSVQ